MKTASIATNKVLFAVLFAALAFDLAGRFNSNNVMSSADLASRADEECAGLIKSGIEGGSKEGGCTLTFNTGTTEARVRRVTKGSKSSDWSRPAPAPAPAPVTVQLPEVKRPELEVCTDAKKFKTKAKQAECRKRNDEKESEYSRQVADRENKLRPRAEAPRAEAQKEEEFEIEVITTGSDCAECRETETFAMDKTASPLSIAQKIRAAADKQNKAMIAAQKKRETDRLAEEKIQKEINNCVRSEDRKVLSASDRTQCQFDKILVGDRKESTARFNDLKTTLNQMLQSGSEEERRQALNFTAEIARSSNLPRDVRETAQVMHVAGNYQSKINSVTESLARTPMNSPVRSFHLQRLNGLNQQMQWELGSAMNRLGMSANMGQGVGAYEEILNWYGVLQNSMSMAVNSPTTMLGQNQIGQFNPLMNNGNNMAVNSALGQQQQVLNNVTGMMIPASQQQSGPGTPVRNSNMFNNQFPQRQQYMPGGTYPLQQQQQSMFLGQPQQQMFNQQTFFGGQQQQFSGGPGSRVYR